MVSEANNADVLASSAIQCINRVEHHDELERMVIINRLSKLEEDSRILFEMLNKVKFTIDSVVERLNNM